LAHRIGLARSFCSRGRTPELTGKTATLAESAGDTMMLPASQGPYRELLPRLITMSGATEGSVQHSTVPELSSRTHRCAKVLSSTTYWLFALFFPVCLGSALICRLLARQSLSAPTH
jgi:hypothetical protein